MSEKFTIVLGGGLHSQSVLLVIVLLMSNLASILWVFNSKKKKKKVLVFIVLFFFVYLPQPFSSLLSLQSSLWSHTWLEGTQFPLSHLNLPGGQVGAGVWHRCGSSSDSSPQSLSPSHWKSCEIQRPFWQVNWCCWHARYVQPCSSLLSPQSLRRSHLLHRTDAKQMFLSVSKVILYLEIFLLFTCHRHSYICIQ